VRALIERVGHVSDTELLHKRNPEPVRRLEVFTGTGRRRGWTAEQKAQILAESYEGVETVSAVARRHGLTPQQLFGWRREARRRAIARRRPEGESGSVFAPVIVEPARACAEAAPASGGAVGAPVIEIVIGAATVRVPLGADAASLQTVLRAVTSV
jgi:transposase